MIEKVPENKPKLCAWWGTIGLRIDPKHIALRTRLLG